MTPLLVSHSLQWVLDMDQILRPGTSFIVPVQPRRVD